MKRRLLVIIASLLVLSIANANDIYEVTASRLNIRTAPSPTASVLSAITQGTQIEVIKIESGWAKIVYGNRNAFVNSRYIRFVKSLNKSKVEEPKTAVPKVTETTAKKEVPVKKEEVYRPVVTSNNEFSTLLNGPGRISRNFNLYYGLSAGAGYSTFLNNAGININGTVSYTADLFAELCFDNRVSFIPKNWFLELQIGFDHKGAAWYPINYVHCRLNPFGYKLPLKSFKLVAKAGVYIGYPLNDLYSYSTSIQWEAKFQAGVNGALGFEYKQFGLMANVEYNFVNVADLDEQISYLTLRNFAIFGTFSYKFGQIKH